MSQSSAEVCRDLFHVMDILVYFEIQQGDGVEVKRCEQTMTNV